MFAGRVRMRLGTVGLDYGVGQMHGVLLVPGSIKEEGRVG